MDQEDTESSRLFFLHSMRSNTHGLTERRGGRISVFKKSLARRSLQWSFSILKDEEVKPQLQEEKKRNNAEDKEKEKRGAES